MSPSFGLIVRYLLFILGRVEMIEISVTSEIKDRDETPGNRTCGFVDMQEGWLSEQALEYIDHDDLMEVHERRSEEEGGGIHYPWNSNRKSRYIELVIVVDTRIFIQFGRNVNSINNMCIEIAKRMNSIYAPLNIYIALVGVLIWKDFDQIHLDRDADITLKRFLHYRKHYLSKLIPNDNAQLLTGFHFDSGIVGKALKGPICTSEFSGGVNVWDTNDLDQIAATLAHELGHNLGMDHDGEHCECPKEKCLMSSAAMDFKSTFWSSCSFQYLAMAFKQGMEYCLRNRPMKLFGGPVCGNGFVEPGEECDCGLPKDCTNKCCSAETCTLTTHAECGAGQCCQFDSCQLRPAGTRCRSTSSQCDLPEFCDGQSEFCPRDVHKSHGTHCSASHGDGHCYSGYCATHASQCRLLWGPSAIKSDDKCFHLNIRGDNKGNCGYKGGNRTQLRACRKEDVLCGMMHCSHLNEKLEFGLKNVAMQSKTFLQNGKTVLPCRNALVDLGLDQTDPGLAPSGASCGKGKMCLNHKCVPLAFVQIPCPGNCNGHGVCNSAGHCHCDKGWAPPDCDNAGPGGSVDSGPLAPITHLPISGYSYIVWFSGGMVLVAVIIAIARQCWLARKTAGDDDYRVLIEKSENDEWQSKSAHQLPLPRAFQL